MAGLGSGVGYRRTSRTSIGPISQYKPPVKKSTGYGFGDAGKNPTIKTGYQNQIAVGAYGNVGIPSMPTGSVASAPSAVSRAPVNTAQPSTLPIGGLPQMQDWINQQHKNATLEANVNALQTADQMEGLRKRLESERRQQGAGGLRAGDEARIASQQARLTAQNQNALTLGRERDISQNIQYQGTYGLGQGGLALNQQNMLGNQNLQWAGLANQQNQQNMQNYLSMMNMIRSSSMPGYPLPAYAG